MKNFVIVAYHTPDDLYKEEAQKFRASMQKLNLDYMVRQIPDQGGWSANTNYKPGFIKECLTILARPVLYVDVDALFQKAPDLIEGLNCDFACHVRDGHELLTGTLYFEPTPRAFSLIEFWTNRIKNEPLVWEQRHLHNALRLDPHGANFVELPASYCQIFDIMKNAGEPVIEHFQASRRVQNAF